MNNYPPNSASRRPEGSWGGDEDDFRIVPPPAVSAPVSSPVSAPPPAMAPPPPPPPPPMAARPMPPPVMVAPATTRAPKQASGNRQRLFLAIGAAAVLLAAFAFFVIFQILLNPQSSSNNNAAAGPLVVVASTAVAQRNFATAVPGCAELIKGPATDAAFNQALAQTYLGCGKYLVDPDHADVVTALIYFKKADALTPKDAEVAHQIDLATRYQTAKLTLAKPDIGGYIGQLEWFTKQPEFDKRPYADTASMLYHAYIDSGNGYLQVPACDLAQHRFEQAVAVKFVADTSEARRRLDDTLQTCKKSTPAAP
jgi:hypothetical protein